MAFNKDIPTSSTSLKASNPQILANQSQVQEALSFDHQFEGTDAATQTGKHEKVTLIEIADLGTGSDGLTILGAQIVNVKPELVYVDEDDNDIQLTSAGKSGSATTDLLANDATISGNETVAGTLGVTGTLDVTGNIDPTTYETTNGGFLDEDDLVSDLATSTASQQSIKAFVSNYVKLVDSKSTTTDGGTFTAGAWQTRDITEEADVGSNVSVSSNVITLAAGTYQCSISCPGFAVDNHQARLRNTTGGVTVLAGTSENTSIDSGTRSFIVGVFTIAASQTLEIQHRCNLTNTVNGFGNANGFGENEIYTIAEFWKR